MSPGTWFLRATGMIVEGLTDWHHVKGFAIGVVAKPSDQTSEQHCVQRVTEALDLIGAYSPRQFARMRRDVRRILVRKLQVPSVVEWMHPTACVRISDEFVLHAAVTANDIAGVMLNAGIQARLGHHSRYSAATEVRCTVIRWRHEAQFFAAVPGAASSARLIEALTNKGRLSVQDDESLDEVMHSVQSVIEEYELPAWEEQRAFRRLGIYDVRGVRDALK